MLGFAFAALHVLFGIGNITVKQFEHAAALEIAGKLEGSPNVSIQTRLNGFVGGPLGDIEQVTINASCFTTQGLPLFVEPTRSKKGVLRHLNLNLRDFNLKKLHIEALKASIPDCRFDYGLAVRHKQFRLSRSGEGAGEVVISEGSLNAFILDKFKEIKSVKVNIDRDKLTVSGHGEFLLLTTDFEVIATLEIHDKRKLVLSNTRIWFDGNRTSTASAQPLLKTLNPVVDLDRDLDLHGAIDLEKLDLNDHKLKASGLTRIPSISAE